MLRKDREGRDVCQGANLIMALRDSFEQLLNVLSEIRDREIATAIIVVRHYRAGIDGSQRFPHLARIVSRLDQNALSWLETVLCARSQHVGSAKRIGRSIE
jgi:hypothetical protein